MLLLMRRTGESIIITAPDGTRIVIRVERLDRGQARLGIEAPRAYIIDREEIDRLRRAEKGEIEDEETAEVNGNV